MSGQQGGLKEMRERMSGYHVYDQHYERVGKVDDLFVDHNDELEYIGLKLGGMFGSKTALIPMEMVRINDRRDLVEIAADKKYIEDSPTFGKDEELTPDYEDRVYRHFGLQNPDSSGQRGSYSDFQYDGEERRHEEGSRSSDGDPDEVDTEYGERAGSGDASSEQQRTEGGREDEGSSRSEQERSERDRSETTATNRREGSQSEGREEVSSGSSDRPRIRKRLRVPAQGEEDRAGRVESESGDDGLRVRKKVVEGEGIEPEGTVGPGEDTGRRSR